MNIAYYRTASRDRASALARLRDEAAAAGFDFVGAVDLPDGKTTIATVCNPTWAAAVLSADRNLLGLIPCSVALVESGGSTLVGAALPSILASVAPSEEALAVASLAESALRALVEKVAEAAPRKPASLKLYSTRACPYCSMEKSWLDGKKVRYDLVYVDDDQAAAEDLANRTGQMGVPVTEVGYDDGETEFVIGFDRPALETIVAAIG